MSDHEAAIFGIDLGTTYSCIAYVDQHGQPVVLNNAEGYPMTPSVVYLGKESNIVVGEEAKKVAMLYPERVVQMVKRHIGKTYENGKPWQFSYEGIDYSPEEISSYILRKLATDAATTLGRPVTDVVITCPAYFGIAEREATARAGELAGLNVFQIINEPTAAAIAYGMQHEQQEQVVLVYDLGGGTFDVTMISVKVDAIEVVATGGDYTLGGRDWDRSIVGYLASQWMSETRSPDDPRESLDTLQELWQKAESAKHSLSLRDEIRVIVVHNGQPVEVSLTREEFNIITADLLDQTIKLTREMLAIAEEKGFPAFDQLLLVGGSTKMPQVKERLIQVFGLEPKMYEPDEAVAKGAAIYGHKLVLGEKMKIEIATLTGATPDKVDLEQVDEAVFEQSAMKVASEAGLRVAGVKNLQKTKITNVASHGFGILAFDDQGREIVANLVNAQQQLPVSITRTLHTAMDEMATLQFQVLENDSLEEKVYDLSAARTIGEYTLVLPPHLPKGSPIEIAFHLNQEGRLRIVGHEPISKNSFEVIIQTEVSLLGDNLGIQPINASSTFIGSPHTPAIDRPSIPQTLEFAGEARLPKQVYEGSSQNISLFLKLKSRNPGLISDALHFQDKKIVKGGVVTDVDVLIQEKDTLEQFLEVELQAAGFSTKGDERQRQSLSQERLEFRWNCKFESAGNHEFALVFKIIHPSGERALGTIERAINVMKFDHTTKGQAQLAALLLSAAGFITTVLAILEGIRLLGSK